NQEVASADITARNLVFTPVSNATATPEIYSLSLHDALPISANGGYDLSTAAYTLTINVTSVNDAPSGADKTVTTAEDTAYTFTAARKSTRLNYSHVENTYAFFCLKTIPTAGTLKNNGIAVTV